MTMLRHLEMRSAPREPGVAGQLEQALSPLLAGELPMRLTCWGSMSLYAAEHLGVHVTAVTIAAEQKRFVDNRIGERGLEDLVEIRLQDYREVPDDGFDAVVSLEMGKHAPDRLVR